MVRDRTAVQLTLLLALAVLAVVTAQSDVGALGVDLDTSAGAAAAEPPSVAEAVPDDPAEQLVAAAGARLPQPPPLTTTANPPLNEALAGKGYTKDEMARLETTVKSEVAAAKTALARALADPATAWRDYCRRFNLTDRVCTTARRDIFIANLNASQARNKERNDDFLAFGITQFSHLSKEEFAASMLMDPLVLSNTTGRIARMARLARQREANNNRKLLQGTVSCGTNTSFTGLVGTAPSFWDWRNAGVITPVRNQWGCGSCSAFATVATLESTWIRKWWGLGYRNTNTDLSEDEWLECTAGNQCKGAWPDSVFDRYICKGAPFESAQPYDAMDGNTCKTSISRYDTGAVGFAYIDKDPKSLAKAVRRNPTVIGVDATNWHGLAAGWVRNCGEPFNKTNHAVAVVGWVDDVPMSNGEVWDFWFVRNSWGTGFVNSGYIWIRKDCAEGSIGPYGMYKTKSWTPVM